MDTPTRAGERYAATLGDGVVEVLRGCAALILAQGEVRPAWSLPAAVLIGVEDGFVAVRRTAPSARRSVIVDDAGAGGVLLAPTPDDELVGLVSSRVRIVSSAALDRLLSEPECAHVICDALAFALGRREELVASLSNARHVERVRDRLLRLASDCGKVDGRGVRIDLPLTHELRTAAHNTANAPIKRI